MANLPLDTLFDLARTSMANATHELGARQKQLHAAHEQLRLLEQYLQDYRTRLQSRQQEGLSAARWQNYQRFIGMIEGAIGEQRKTMSHAERQLQAGRQAWQHHKRRLSSFDALVARRNLAERQREARAEQRLNDEYAAARSAAPRFAPASSCANSSVDSSNHVSTSL